MCDRLETAFCRMWEAAGLGSAAAAAARPHVLSPPAPQLSRNEARGKPHQRQPHGRAGAKPSPRGTAAKPGAAQESSAAVKPAGGRKHGHGGSSPGTGPPAKRPRAQGAAPGALSLPSTAPPATAPELLPSEFPLVSPQLADAEVAEETLELERLLAAGGTSPTAVAAEAAAAGGTASPVLWEAPLPGGLGPEGVAEAVAAPGAQLDAAAAGSYKASGKAAATQRDPFAAQWQATGAPGLAAPPASGRSAADVLLHPDREPVHGSLPPPMLPHNSLGQPSFPPLGDQPQQADVQLHAPLGATSGNVPEGPQQEEGVLVAWQRVQAQREAAQQAMAAAEAAAHEVVKARQVCLDPRQACLAGLAPSRCCCTRQLTRRMGPGVGAGVGAVGRSWDVCGVLTARSAEGPRDPSAPALYCHYGACRIWPRCAPPKQPAAPALHPPARRRLLGCSSGASRSRSLGLPAVG